MVEPYFRGRMSASVERSRSSVGLQAGHERPCAVYLKKAYGGLRQTDTLELLRMLRVNWPPESPRRFSPLGYLKMPLELCR